MFTNIGATFTAPFWLSAILVTGAEAEPMEGWNHVSGENAANASSFYRSHGTGAAHNNTQDGLPLSSSVDAVQLLVRLVLTILLPVAAGKALQTIVPWVEAWAR